MLPVEADDSYIKYFTDVDASLGIVELSADPNERNYRNIMIPGYEDCTHAINVYGDSMYPLIKSGQIILMRLWEESFFDYGKIYLIITNNNYRIVKRVFPWKESRCIELRSENSEVPPYEICLDDVKCSFIVLGWIGRDAP
jgi:phage repressor protein C with HTH and peptisase S24 domain